MHICDSNFDIVFFKHRRDRHTLIPVHACYFIGNGMRSVGSASRTVSVIQTAITAGEQAHRKSGDFHSTHRYIV